MPTNVLSEQMLPLKERAQQRHTLNNDQFSLQLELIEVSEQFSVNQSKSLSKNSSLNNLLNHERRPKQLKKFNN